METKGKKGLVQKLSALERTTQEGEALLKVFLFSLSTWHGDFYSKILLLWYYQKVGYKEDGEDQGRRRTRSGSKPSPVATPPPAKKEKKASKTPTIPLSGELNVFFQSYFNYFENNKCFVLVLLRTTRQASKEHSWQFYRKWDEGRS